MAANPDVPTPPTLLQQAIQKVPATKYALAVGGLFSVIAIAFVTFKENLWIAVFGPVVMFVLMAVFVIFANLAGQKKEVFLGPVISFTWFSLILIMATAVLLFTSVFGNWPMNLRPSPADPRTTYLLARIERLKQDAPPPDNSWVAYKLDFIELGNVTRQYLHYIEGNPNADPDNKVISNLQGVSLILKTRNENGPKSFPGETDPAYHSKVLPNLFADILERINENKSDISPDREPCYEAAIYRWHTDAGFQGVNAPALTPDCQDYLKIALP